MSGSMLRVFAYELRRNLRRKAYLFTTFGVPVLGFLLVMGMAFLGGSAASNPLDSTDMFDLRGVTDAGYVDLTGEFDDPGELANIFTRYPDEDAASAALEAEEIQVYYVIEADYLETGKVRVVMPRFNISYLSSNHIRRMLLEGLREEIDSPELFQRLLNPATYNEIRLLPGAGEDTADAPAGQNPDAQFMFVYIFAIILLMSLFVTNGYLMQSVIEEKETRLIEILISSLRPFELLAGKILALGLLGLLQMTVWLGSILLLPRLTGFGGVLSMLRPLVDTVVPPGLVPLMVGYFILAYLLFAGLYSIVGALSNSMREGPQYAAVFTLPAVVPMWFMQLIIATPNDPLPVFLSLFPITAPLGMIERLAVTTVPAWQIALSVGLLALTVVGVMWLAGRVFRVQTLLAGQAFKLKDLPKLVRG